MPDLLCCCFTVSGPVRPGLTTAVSPWPIADRIRAVADAGYRGVGFYIDDLLAIRADVGFEAVGRMLVEHEIRHCQVETLFDWWLDDVDGAASGERRRVVMEALEQFAVPDSHLKCGPDLSGATLPVEQYSEGFAALAEETRRAGGRVGLEFMPFSDISTPAAALDVVERAGQPSGGIVIDVWHVQRGGTPYDALREIPGERIVMVELDDADEEPASDLYEDTLDRRRLCGEGGLDLSAFLDAIRATGYDGAYGVEILSEAQRALPLERAARDSFGTTLAQFQPRKDRS